MLQTMLAGYEPYDETEAVILRQLREFLAESANPYDRANLMAHVIADAWIVNPARSHVVLHHHVANDLWTTPGGHCDGSPDVLAAALREAAEESGLTALTSLCAGVFDLNSGKIPPRQKPWGLEPAHIHFDVCYAFEAAQNAKLRLSEESHQLRWVPLDEADQLVLPEHRRRIAKTRTLLTIA